jgi:hypothetical protein
MPPGGQIRVSDMSKENVKKAPQKTPKEKKAEKREKRQKKSRD